MKRRRHTPEQIVRKIAEGDKMLNAGSEIAEVAIELRAWLRTFSKDHPRWGWKRAYHQLRREGHRVNAKRIQRLWRLEGLKVPYKKRKQPLRGIGTPVGAMSPIRPDVLWAFDFPFNHDERWQISEDPERR